MYFEGDRVIYSQKHWEWLESVYQTGKYELRQHRIGTVRRTRENGTVEVDWKDKLLVHFPDNLEPAP